jgi:hypothetical protein
MGPTNAGSQVYFGGVQVSCPTFPVSHLYPVTYYCPLCWQNVNGVSASEFESNPIAVSAWKATVAKACDGTNSDLIRVDIVSVDDLGRRLSGDDAADIHSTRRLRAKKPRTAVAKSSKHANLEPEQMHILSAARVNFEVSFTLQDFHGGNVNITTAKLKENYQLSVTNRTFVKEFAEEIKRRTNDTIVSAKLIEQIHPAEVVLAPAFTVIQTTDRPTYRPSASPTTGALKYCVCRSISA